MFTKELETKVSKLNPLFLQAALDEVAKRRKDEWVDELSASPFSPFAIHEAMAKASVAGVKRTETPEIFRVPEIIVKDQPLPALDAPNEPPATLAKVKSAIDGKWAEIDQAQQQLDRLFKIKAVVEQHGPMAVKPDVNELRMKRLAIQMALVADSSEYDEKDLLDVDRQIAALNNLGAANREPEISANYVERSNLNVKIVGLEDKIRGCKEELNALILGHNLRVAYRKADDYIKALQAANTIRHELLALAELLAGEELLMDMKLGGELPIPSGLEPFDGIFTDSLSTSLEGIELAKKHIRSEILP